MSTLIDDVILLRKAPVFGVGARCDPVAHWILLEILIGVSLSASQSLVATDATHSIIVLAAGLLR
jgi:hypothetical protein